MYHPYAMAHVELREMAFQMRSAELRNYGQDVLKRDPKRVAAAEVLDLMAYLVECDFVGAEAKVDTIKFRFKKTPDEAYVDAATSLAMSHINFAFGRFKELDISIDYFLANNRALPKLEKGEFLDILRILAQKSMILDQFDRLESIYKEMIEYEIEDQSPNLLYLVNSVHAMVLMSHGEFIKANEVARRNLEIAKQHGYTGLMAPIDSMYVMARAALAGAKNKEALEIFDQIKEMATKYSQWPWYFMADGYSSREHALKNEMTEALAIVREEREKLAAFNFKHDLNFIPDINELYVRHLIKDIERMQTLLDRVPNLIMVQQMRALTEEWRGVQKIDWYEKLPDRTPREKIYKLVALAEFYIDKESVAVDYMFQALQIAEVTGQVEFILRQYRLFDIIQKAIAKKPTVFLEYMGTRIAERINQNNEKNRKGLPVPLTNRELEVVRHLSTGIPISAISSSLHVSMNTMKTHLRNIYRKLDVDGRETAVIRAKELFLI